MQAPAVSLPKGGGAIRGMGEKFAASPVTGTGSMTVPIAASPGRGGFGPQLSLTYDSGAGNGPFGLGWQLSSESITRRTDRGIPLYRDADESDTYLLSGAEDLVPAFRQDKDGSWVAAHVGYTRDAQKFLVRDANGELVIHEDEVGGYRVRRYRPRTEGMFARIERWSNLSNVADVYWRITSRDNITILCGNSATSRIADPADASRIFSWLIAERYDDKGNSIVYDYATENDRNVDLSRVSEARRSRAANRYLSSIKYGNSPSRLSTQYSTTLKWRFELQFEYGDGQFGEGVYREDPPAASGNQFAYVRRTPPQSLNWPARLDAFSSSRSGFEVRCHRLCSRILFFHRFDELLGDEAQLVRATEIEYAPAPTLTRVKAISHCAYVPTSQKPAANGERQYLKRRSPPLEFGYTEPEIDPTIRDVDAGSMENLPRGFDGTEYQWVDLDRQGLSGLLTQYPGGWYYKRNLGPINLELDSDGRTRARAKFAPVECVAVRPNVTLGSSAAQFMDLAADGALDAVMLDGPTPGFYRSGTTRGWERFQAFISGLNRDMRDPNLRMVDLDGDGLADVLITEDEVLTWHPSLGETGYGPAQRVAKPRDEDVGPALVFDDGTQSIFLADMSGDGLVDLVRIRNGEVCYWPNLGYALFGAKITMDASPWFDSPDAFDQRRIRLADVDGSGCTDIVYLHSQGARIYFNQAGNAWSPAQGRDLPVFPRADDLSSVNAVDLLGNGTICLVWSSALPGEARAPMKYVDLMSGRKPHLLSSVRNNLGARTDIEYTPSTQFYLKDRLAGNPWVTRLPFPVHCVSKTTVFDKWRHARFTTRYSYHHGYFDAPEREFRGFGRVEQLDCEDYGTFSAGNTNSPYISVDHSLYQPPVKTVTWYHTGAFLDDRRTLAHYSHEYFPTAFLAERPQWSPALGQFTEIPLPAPDLDNLDLTSVEWREALRACKGMQLRQEVYELDVDDLRKGLHTPVKLFSSSLQNCHISLLQPRSDQRYAVFRVTQSEAISYHYELDLRSPAVVDPRVSHTLNLELDDLGQVLRSVAVGYPRQQAFVDTQNALQTYEANTLRDSQAQLHLGYSEMRYTDQDIDSVESYRLRLPCEVATFELTGFHPQNARYFSIDELRGYRLSAGQSAGQTVTPIAYHVVPDGTVQKRAVALFRTLFFDDAGTSNGPSQPLPFGQHGPRGLKYEEYKLALTDALLDAVIGTRLDDPLAGVQTARDVLDDWTQSGYLQGTDLEQLFSPVSKTSLAGQYWIRSGIAGFSSDTPLHFFVPERYTDAFGNTTVQLLDSYDLMVRSSTDARGNQTNVLSFDYRVLAPTAMQDPNANVTRAAFDVFGMPVAMALEAGGDSLTGLGLDALNPTIQDKAQFFALTPYSESQPRAWLANATTRFVYHFGETVTANGAFGWEARPSAACTVQRETHVGALAGGPSRIKVAVEYSDGGADVLVKILQAEPDPTDTSGAPPLRWIASGKTVFNNKGNPVKQYEPYFNASEHRFEAADTAAEVGVTSILYYDAPGRLIRTEFPDGSFSSVGFSPWMSLIYDRNDTVLTSDWYTARGSPDPGAAMPGLPDQRAAWLAAHHANTPAQTHLDSLGRAVVAIEHNRMADDNDVWTDAYHVAFTKLDTEGKPLWVRDARGNLVMQYIVPPKATRWSDEPNEDIPATSAPCYDMSGMLLFQHSMDAGDRRTLMDAAGKPMLAWDQNERQVGGNFVLESRSYFMQYDSLHRPTATWLRAGSNARVMAERHEYRDTLNPDGSANANLASDQANNLVAQAVLHYDPSGRLQLVRRDFKGNTLQVARRLNNLPTQSLVDWQNNPESALATDEFTQITEFDALNRTTLSYNWHRGVGTRVAVDRPQYNERGLLQSNSLTVGAQKTVTGADLTTGTTLSVIEEVRYNAKGQKIYFARGRKASLASGKGTLTEYEYDPQTFRLTQIFTTRPSNARPPASRHSQLSDSGVIQELDYTFDPVGNITECADEAYEPVFFQGQKIEPRSQYEYDALYRLTRASGRENGAFTGAPQNLSGGWNGLAFPIAANDPNALRTYTQSFDYDSVGNLARVRHDAGIGTWTRRYHCADDSNRLAATWDTNDGWAEVGAADVTHYDFDTHGNLRNLNESLTRFDMQWDHRDMVGDIDLGGGGHAYYQYDSAKQRTRKRVVNQNGLGGYWERIYLGGYELYRRFGAADLTTPLEEIETLHLLAANERILLIDDVIATDRRHANGTPYRSGPIFRFQFSNHLGSASLELDDLAQIVSYEEFHPYGTSAYQSMTQDTEAPPKRYRYTGMERDEESGLSYHAARYYLPWAARWCSYDPLGLADGVNCFAYAKGNPITKADTEGTQTTTPTKAQASTSVVAADGDQSGVSITPQESSSAAPEPLTASPVAGFTGGETGVSDYSAYVAERDAQLEEIVQQIHVQQHEWDLAFAKAYEEESHRFRFPLGTTDDPAERAAEERVGPRPQTPDERAFLARLQFALFLLQLRSGLGSLRGARPSVTTVRAGITTIDVAPAVEEISAAAKRPWVPPAVKSTSLPADPTIGIKVGNETLYGPFYRTGDVTGLMKESGEWRGRGIGNTGAGYSDIPSALAYTRRAGPIYGEVSTQFFTTVKPTSIAPAQVGWHTHNTFGFGFAPVPVAGVRHLTLLNEDWAAVKVYLPSARLLLP